MRGDIPCATHKSSLLCCSLPFLRASVQVIHDAAIDPALINEYKMGGALMTNSKAVYLSVPQQPLTANGTE
jgi:hypothetical protein